MRFLTLSFLFLTCFSFWSHAQGDNGLTDGRQDPETQPCRTLIESRPKEILFGIHIRSDSVYFSMSNEDWFNKIFADDDYGVCADIVSKDQFKCGSDGPDEDSWHIGTLIEPMYRSAMKNHMSHYGDGEVEFSIGALPPKLRGKEVEGNLVILKVNKVCYYSRFTALETSLWELLDMGLFTDSLLSTEKIQSDQDTLIKKLYFTEKKTVIIPFEKGKTVFTPADTKRLYQTMALKGYRVEKINIRAFSTVEGEYASNVQLQNQRAANILAALQSFQKDSIRAEIVTGENWVEFMQSIDHSPFAYLMKLSKQEIKKRLEKKSLLDSLESRLKKQRKAVVTVYLVPKSEIDNINDERVLDTLKTSIKNNDIEKSVRVLRAIFEKVADNHIPSDYMDRVEIPEEKSWSRLRNDYSVYRYMLGGPEADAIAELQKIEKTAPDNGKIKYNICALQLRLWQYDEKAVNKDVLLHQIADLQRYGIKNELINRMMINYNIIMCEIYMKNEQYDAKDLALNDIKAHFINKDLRDRDLLSIGKYFSEYIQYDWADEILRHRIDKLDVDEDLLFFYINLSMLRNVDFEKSPYKDMVYNAISINPKRFCRFFNSSDNGGINLQLLLEPFWKDMYCQNCKK